MLPPNFISLYFKLHFITIEARRVRKPLVWGLNSYNLVIFLLVSALISKLLDWFLGFMSVFYTLGLGVALGCSSMGRRTTTIDPSSSGGSKHAKMSSSTPSSNAPSNWAQAAWGNRPPHPHAISKYELRFSNSEHIARYDSIASSRIIEPKYMDVDFLKTVRL